MSSITSYSSLLIVYLPTFEFISANQIQFCSFSWKFLKPWAFQFSGCYNKVWVLSQFLFWWVLILHLVLLVLRLIKFKLHLKLTKNLIYLQLNFLNTKLCFKKLLKKWGNLVNCFNDETKFRNPGDLRYTEVKTMRQVVAINSMLWALF